MAQNQDGGQNTPLAQLPGLIQTGDRQIVRSQPLQLGGGLYRSVAVGVRLHHTQILDAGTDEVPGLAVVMGQGIQVNLRPSPS